MDYAYCWRPIKDPLERTGGRENGVAFPENQDARALAVVAPLTSHIRGMRGEVERGKPRWLPKHSAVNMQGLASFDHRKLSRRMGELSTTQMTSVNTALRDLQGL